MYNANLQLTSSKMYQILILSKLLNIYQYMELYSHKISTALSFAYHIKTTLIHVYYWHSICYSWFCCFHQSKECFKDPFEQINIIANLFSWWYVEPQMDTGVDYTDGKFHSQPLKSEE